MARYARLQPGSSRLRRGVRRVQNWSFTIAVGVTLVVAGLLGHSSLATAQPTSPGLDPSFFPATGYGITTPAMLDYFQHRGGLRTFGYPVSNEFPLLGKRVQIFQRQMLELDADGSVSTATILDPNVLPVTHIDGLSLPSVDPQLAATAPPVGSADYGTSALAFVDTYVSDTWNGLPVNFLTTFNGTVTCADAFGTDPCDQSLLPAFALELWGLPTSLPTLDPLNTDFVYQRFQKGIMHFSLSTGLTQGLLIGDWLKRVIMGVDLSPDLSADVRSSPFYAQYAPSLPLALDRPTDLPDTSLAQAFHADTLAAAGQAQPEPTLPANVAQTATAVAMTATAVTGTQVALQGTQAVIAGTQAVLTSTSDAETATAVAQAATAAVSQETPTPTPGSVVSNIPVVNVGCLGDEQMWFTPRRPNTGTHVDISVTSQRHHDARYLRLTGPLDPGPVTERVGTLGFVWTWTVVPVVEDFYEWTFYADGLRPCITSGFNAYEPLGSTATPTATPIPSNTPGATPTPTPTIVPVPTLIDVTPSNGLTCNSIVTLRGNGFGTPPSTFGTTAFLVSSGPQITLQQIGTGSNTSIRVQLPSSGLTPGSAAIQVSSGGGDSGTVPVTVIDCSLANTTPTPSNTPTQTPQPAPSNAQLSSHAGNCTDPITITGSNFGTPPSGQLVPTGGLVDFSQRTAVVSSWSNTSILIFPPTGAPSGNYTIIVVTSSGNAIASGLYALTAPTGSTC